MTRQEIFDKVATHLIKQGKRCSRQILGEETCVYRNQEGLKCAIGCLIPDDKYSVTLEGSTVMSSSVTGYVSPLSEILSTVGIDMNTEAAFLRNLQDIHDRSEPETWKFKLEQLAWSCGLDGSVTK